MIKKLKRQVQRAQKILKTVVKHGKTNNNTTTTNNN